VEQEAPSIFYQEYLKNPFGMTFREPVKNQVITWKNFCKYKFTSEETRGIIRVLAKGLSKLHDFNIIHRDVHPSRIHEFPVFRQN
jgi:serine/threonine protein kinase